VFVNLWEGAIGRPLRYATVDKLIARTHATLVYTHPTAGDLRRALDERGSSTESRTC
jgi:hypothetical protein